MSEGKKVVHTIMVEMKADLSPEEEQNWMSGVNSLSTIDGVESVVVGRTFTTQRAQGYVHILCVYYVYINTCVCE
jgi:hypothetical protein